MSRSKESKRPSQNFGLSQLSQGWAATWKWPFPGDRQALALAVPSSRNNSPDTALLEHPVPLRLTVLFWLPKLCPHCGPWGWGWRRGGQTLVYRHFCLPAPSTWAMPQGRADQWMMSQPTGVLLKTSHRLNLQVTDSIWNLGPERNPWDRQDGAPGCLEHWAAPWRPQHIQGLAQHTRMPGLGGSWVWWNSQITRQQG